MIKSVARLVLLFIVVSLTMVFASAALASDKPNSPPEPPQAREKWTGPDKTLHFGASAIAGFIARDLYKKEPWKAVGWAMVPGIIKEATDKKPSGKDMVANFAGALVGVYIGGCHANHQRIVCGFEF